MNNETRHRFCRRAAFASLLRFCVAVVLVCWTVCVPGVDGASQCGEALECSGMTAARREMIRARIATSGSFFHESCSSVIVGHALNYKPTATCENDPEHKESAALVKKLVETCFADAVTLISPARLCETHAQFLASSFVWLNVLIVITTTLMSEWVHYYD